MSTFTPPPPQPGQPPMPMAPITSPAAPAEPPLSEGARLINTFIAPAKTFTDIRRNPSWWVPFVLASLLSIVFSVVIGQKVGYDRIANKVLESNKQLQEQPAQVQERVAGFTATMIKWTGYLSPIVVLLGGVVVGAGLMATFNFGMAAEVPFTQSLAIAFYAWLPSLLQNVLALLGVLLGNPEGFNLQNPVGTNIAYFLDPQTTSPFVYTFLQGIDVFNIWIVVLLGLGFALNAKKKISTGTAIGTVAAWLLLIKLIQSGIALRRG